MLDDAVAYCKKITARSRSNFHYAFLFLPRDQREALEAVYAYCRLVDDVVDEEGTEAEKRAGLARWRGELDAVFGDAQPSHPVAARLREAVRRFPIRREDVEGVIDGCEMDISQTRYSSWEELRTYCYRVASCVGLMCVEIFGSGSGSRSGIRAYAIDLGIALQLTNILRDVAEDARRGRIYLPADEMASFGVSERDLVSGRRSPEFLRLMRANAQRAEAHYLRARAAIGESERRRLVIAEIMGDIYHALLERLEATGFDVFGEKITIGRRKKMSIALGNFARAKLHSLRA